MYDGVPQKALDALKVALSHQDMLKCPLITWVSEIKKPPMHAQQQRGFVLAHSLNERGGQCQACNINPEHL
jgi:hypothetical protein